MIELPLTELAAALQSRELSPLDLVGESAARIESLDVELNAVVVRDLDRAVKEARTAERRLGRDAATPLTGIPCTAKEPLEVAGLPACEASLLRERVIATKDAEAVARLREAGAIFVGKGNVSEFALFPDAVNLVYGATRNPHDATRSAGGSSGGDACAVAAGLVSFGVGSDYGGSIRAPAHFCGVVGVRAGSGAIPLAGHLPHGQSPGRARWTTLGPLARRVADARLVLEVLTGRTLTPRRPRRVTIFRDALGRPISASCAAAVERAATILEERGWPVDEAVPPVQLAAENAFDATTLIETRNLLSEFLPERIDEVSPQLRLQWEVVADATTALPPPDALATLAAKAAAWLTEHPLLLAPAAASTPYPLGALAGDVDGTSTTIFDLFVHCKLASALGLPAAVVPVAKDEHGLPVGVQLIARQGREDELLAVAAELEAGLER